jgi:hypothetical protein
MTESGTPPPEMAPWPGATPAAVPPRAAVPGSVTAAAVILFVGAALTGLFGIILLVFGGLFSSMGDFFETIPTSEPIPEGSIGAMMDMALILFIAISVILLIVAVAQLVAGIGLLRRRGWARILGMVLSVLALLLFAIGLVASVLQLLNPSVAVMLEPMPGFEGFPQPTEEVLIASAIQGAILGLILNALFAGAYAFVLFVLIRRGEVFR